MEEKAELLYCGCASVSLSVMVQAMVLSGLRWKMPPAQVFALQINMLPWDEEETVRETTVDGVTEIGPSLFLSLFGIPITVDDRMPSSTILLTRKDKEIVRIEQLAIPVEFYRGELDAKERSDT